MNIDLAEPLAINWSNLPSETSPGTSGQAVIKMLNIGDLRIRMVNYSAGFLGDHWCVKGHVVQVLDGTLILEIEDGESMILETGMMYVIGDDRQPHRARTEAGAQVLILD